MNFVTRKKRHDSFVPNPSVLRQSILELRGVYSEMSEMEYCLMYERKYGVKWQDVKIYLRSVENADQV
ncbi:hypothetical protein [Paenibacillus sp. Soil724D2]|uniref:hypothetical protein n=1 Tax=Paenibacillus sp. (strain Soil724D2) TaxID=1736392 RepID=UPI00071620A2|nr:hypothetical protein [Paenibacillus sp. Soil724D2]KRE33272.1 hypothetical protein ASG85_13405 [Paenibacillus sp. Soil724D2]